jgi:hypothetical protein
MINAHKFMVGKPESKKSLGRTRCRCENNMKLDLREIRQEVVEWIHLAQDRDQWWFLVKTEMNLHKMRGIS